MSYLRRPTRLTVEHGGKNYAVVEQVILGQATVRLASNGARLTQLPVLSDDISAGDTVIVDYSTGGKPHVRPLTVPTSGTILTASDPNLADTNYNTEANPYYQICKVTSETATTGTFGDMYTWTLVKFDKVLFDPGEMFTGNNFIRANLSGRYIINWKIALSGPPEYPPMAGFDWTIADTNQVNGQPFMYDGSYYNIGGNQCKAMISPGQENFVTIGGTLIATLYAGEKICIRMVVVCQGLTGQGFTTINNEPQYPYLEMWQIASLGSDEKAQRYWFL